MRGAGVCVRGSLCAGRVRVRPCVTVRGVCGCLWRGGEMPMAAVHACAHRWAWACRRVDACAATGAWTRVPRCVCRCLHLCARAVSAVCTRL